MALCSDDFFLGSAVELYGLIDAYRGGTLDRRNRKIIWIARRAAAQVRLPGIDQPLFLRKRQGAQEHGVHHFDDRERGAEAERENARGEQGEARTSNELSDRTGEEAHAARG